MGICVWVNPGLAIDREGLTSQIIERATEGRLKIPLRKLSLFFYLRDGKPHKPLRSDPNWDDRPNRTRNIEPFVDPLEKLPASR